MPKKITQTINSPKLMITLSLTNNTFSNLLDLVSLDFTKINNGIFIKNNSDNDDVSIKFTDVSNTTNTIDLIKNDNIFIEANDISSIQLKRLSANPTSISIIAN